MFFSFRFSLLALATPSGITRPLQCGSLLVKCANFKFIFRDLMHPALVSTVKLLASGSAIYMTLSPLKDMEKVRAKVPIDTLPILCMFANACTWTLYGVLIDNFFPLVVTNSIQVLITIYYLLVIYTNAGPRRLATVKKILAVIFFVFGTIIYALFGPKAHVTKHIGYLGICVCTLMFSSPLATVGTVLKQKSSAILPIRLIAAGIACAFLWTVFGLLINDAFVYGPNGLNLVIGLCQVALYFYYLSPKQDHEDKEFHLMNFSLIATQLQSTAEYEQSDASALLFEHWYDLAKEYASNYSHEAVPDMMNYTIEAFSVIFTSYSVARLHDPSTDVYAVRELLRHAQKILEIIRTKPKFTALMEPSGNSNALAQYLITSGVPAMEMIAFSETTMANIRVDALETLKELVITWTYLAHGPWSEIYSTQLTLCLQSNLLVQVLTSLSTDSIVRDTALQVVLVTAPLAEPGVLVAALARVARDAAALTPLWTMHVLEFKNALDNLIARMRVNGPEQVPIRIFFCIALMESLYEALLNHKTGQEWSFNAALHTCSLVRLFKNALSTFQQMPMDGARRELPDIFLQTVELLLLENPKCEELVEFCLDSDEYALLCVIVRSGHVFTQEIWSNLLLPYTRSQLAKIPVQGVSGSQYDQEIVNLIREACRLYYINIDRVPSPSLGKSLFFTVAQAVRHGYYETERFTELLALIMQRHYILGHLQVYQWLPMLLLPSVASNLKTLRALSEALWICLGLETSSFGCENAIMSGETSKEIANTFCVILARLRTEPADIFWRDICFHFGFFILQHHDAMVELLESISAELEESEVRGCMAVDRLVSLTDLLHAMSLRIETHEDALALFKCGLRAVQMGIGQTTALAFDATLKNVVDKMAPKSTDVDLVMMETAMNVCGVQARSALARLVPEMCLEDVNALVRQLALKYILPREDLIKEHGIAIVRSLYWIHKPMYQTADVSSQLCLDQLSLSLAACPVLVVLARVTPLYIPECVLKLLSAADLHAVNDPLSESKFIEAYLDAVATAGPRSALVRFALSNEGRPTLPLLVRLSTKWHQFVMDVVMTGLLQEQDMILLPQLFPRLERLLEKRQAKVYKCTAQGQAVLNDAMSSEDAAHNTMFWNQLHQLITAEYERGNFMKALRMASTMKTWYPDDYERMGTHNFVISTIFPMLQRTSLPQCYDATTLEAFPIYFRTMHEIKLLFQEEAEKYLDISNQINDFAHAKIQDVVRTNGVTAARALLNLYGLQSPELLALLTESTEETPLLAVAPARVSWATQVVNVMDGELAATSLDDIIVSTDKI
ncbi:MtN3 [Thraustotheca clavata]|uniref:Sugar transporter SWEET1 n=1 Tax=Thraustotheca clavata TaxID=74557 RepID=A0A1V9ZD00_9STRA|nr:MtN3 [Thraustotheca clavata]